ncbi:MAG TPA: DUF6159 family protein [Rhodanobacteraceae bacterium]
MGRFSRSWQLMKASVDVLMHERKLLVFPLISAVCLLLLLASFALPAAWVAGLFSASHHLDVDPHGYHAGWWALLFVFYVVTYAVAFFFNTALVSAALEHLEGGHPTVRGSLARAASKWPSILGFALISATVGMALHALEERLGLIGRWVVSLIGMAWSVVTFMVVPTLAATDVGAITAVKESAGLLKRTWGENIIGNVGLGVAGFLMVLAWMVVLAIVIALGVLTQSVAIVLAGACVLAVAAVFLILVQTALRGVYSAALYRYATQGEPGGGFDTALLEQAFRTRSRRRR